MAEVDLKAVENRIEAVLRNKVRRGIVSITADCLGAVDMTLLTALGVDAKSKLLQIFLEEIKQVLEDTDGT